MRFDFGGFFGVGKFAFGEQPDLERFRQFAGAYVGCSGQHDQLLGLTVFVAQDSCLNGIDLKHRGDRRDPEFLHDCVPRLRAALCSAETFCHRQIQKILVVRQQDL